jgi:hypothetical protein
MIAAFVVMVRILVEVTGRPYRLSSISAMMPELSCFQMKYFSLMNELRSSEGRGHFCMYNATKPESVIRLQGCGIGPELELLEV